MVPSGCTAVNGLGDAGPAIAAVQMRAAAAAAIIFVSLISPYFLTMKHVDGSCFSHSRSSLVAMTFVL